MGIYLVRVGKFIVRTLGLMMLKHVKAALEISGLALHGPSIWTRDIHICLHITRARE